MAYTEALPLSQVGYVFLDVERMFRELDFGPTLQEFMPVLEAREARVFETGTDPGGNALKPLAPATVRKKGHGIILVETGRLDASLSSRTGDSIREATDRGLLFGTSVPYSIFHQTGGTKLPQRQHVGMDSETVDQLVERIADAAVAGLKEN